MNNSKSRYTQIDAGHTIINILSCEEGRNGLCFTAYINGISVKSPALSLARMVRVFIETIVTACDFPEAEQYNDMSRSRAAQLRADLRSYIDATNNN